MIYWPEDAPVAHTERITQKALHTTSRATQQNFAFTVSEGERIDTFAVPYYY